MSTKRIINENSLYWEIDDNTSKPLSDKDKMSIIDKENSAGSEIMS
jgi:hypothetical protein